MLFVVSFEKSYNISTANYIQDTVIDKNPFRRIKRKKEYEKETHSKARFCSVYVLQIIQNIQ